MPMLQWDMEALVSSFYSPIPPEVPPPRRHRGVGNGGSGEDITRERDEVPPSGPLRKNRCYTCKPRGAVKKHIIGTSGCGQFVFHHDMNHRPLIVVTPVHHVTKLYQLGERVLSLLFRAIDDFCNFWKIEDYQVLYNNGTWQTHDHFHVKIRVDERVIGRMRGDHFRLLDAIKERTAPPEPPEGERRRRNPPKKGRRPPPPTVVIPDGPFVGGPTASKPP